MKKLFAIVAVMGVLTFGSTQLAQAQDAPAAEQTEQAAVAPAADAAAPAAMEAAEGGIHKELKTKFIEGTASFMSLVAIALVIGLAFCIERIIYLSLAEINTKKFLAAIEAALEKGDVEAAKDIARNTRGPIASIYYQGLMRIDQGIDVVEKSVVSYGGVQAGYLEKEVRFQWNGLRISVSIVPGWLRFLRDCKYRCYTPGNHRVLGKARCLPESVAGVHCKAAGCFRSIPEWHRGLF